MKINIKDVDVEWMIRRDMPEILDIEYRSFEFPWSKDDFLYHLSQRNCIGMVAKLDDRVIGFMIYELQKTRLHLLNLAVGIQWQRQGVGSLMVHALIKKLNEKTRTRIILEVRETNLVAQFFFRHNGFRAVSILRDFYEDTKEDAYAMQYRIKQPQEQAQA